MNYENFLLQLTKSDKKYMVLTAENRGAIRGLPEQIPDQFLDTGIAEQTMLGMAAGLALRGRIPIVHAMSTFLTMRAFEFIRTDIGLGNLPVILMGSFSGFLSTANGPTHQAVEDISLMRGIPNIQIFCPADEEDMLSALPEIISREEPFYIRFNQSAPHMHHKKFEYGKAESIGDNGEVTILVYGFLLGEALKARDILQQQGLSVKIVNLRMLKPVDESAILEALETSRLVVTLEDHFLCGGLYSILAEIMIRHKIIRDVLPIGLDGSWFRPALLNEVLEYEGFTGAKLAERIGKYR